jgi:hypothetical protein
MYILLSSEITYQLLSFFVVGDYNFVEATINPSSHKNRRKSIPLSNQETSEQFSFPWISTHYEREDELLFQLLK